jgi:hypothetical protein
LLRFCLVIDLHKHPLEQLQIAAGAFILRKIYKDMFRWGETDRLRLAIVLDEAHRVSRDTILPKIMKEGRKFGVIVISASQGISDSHSAALVICWFIQPDTAISRKPERVQGFRHEESNIVAGGHSLVAIPCRFMQMDFPDTTGRPFLHRDVG